MSYVNPASWVRRPSAALVVISTLLTPQEAGVTRSHAHTLVTYENYIQRCEHAVVSASITLAALALYDHSSLVVRSSPSS